MKKTFTLIALLLSSVLFGQVKEGYIKYAVSVDNSSDETMKALIGNMQSRLHFKNTKALYELSGGIFSMKTLVDDKGLLLLTDQMGKKFYMRKNRAQLSAQPSPAPVITYTTEKRTIKGYPCSKAVITVKAGKAGETKTTIWFTEKLQNAAALEGANTLFKDLKGLPLEFEVTNGPVKFKLTATEISTAPVPDATFNVSLAGYKEVSVKG
ncbi:hypothetical protein [Sediminibacterium ginsengisoli]|uniref:GLPGLI family protein n=1 Tax=Sediminibacterium ginsengisoli TaxID=413434 RepID=A0A1T4KQD7_9BACT|nr:hypothetical protein [Sediminibacterium ginsengisoli]SJZ44610.1 GLPGLI family protein [Sediminibacterium ginsengisoli]